jgi:L-2,4-diaminobutyric acid acetyltransferase
MTVSQEIQATAIPQENFPYIPASATVLLESPEAADGAAVHNLIRLSPFLDDNSLYCYLAICTHFRDTSVVARIEGELAGVITAYVPPAQPDTLFVWQVAVAKTAQRRGLARSMLDHILQRPALAAIRWVETSVTKDNKASRSLFDSLARRHQCQIEESVLFDRTEHFCNLHDTEHRLRIGPFRQ